MTSKQSALQYLESARRNAAEIPAMPKEVRPRTLRRVGVVGAGTMGRGIAMNFLNAGVPIVLVETTQEALDAAMALIRGLYEASVAKGKLALSDLAPRMGLLSGSLSYSAMADCDLVIEAVYENMDLKKDVCGRLGVVCKQGAIIATNTSTLDVDVLENPAEAAQILSPIWKTDAAVLEKVIINLRDKGSSEGFAYWSPGSIDMTPLRNAVAGALLTGELNETFDAASLVDASFLPEDLKPKK